MKKTFGILLSILLSLSLAAPNAAFAGDDEPKKTPAERAKELQDKINSSAKDRAWTGLKEDIFEVPKPGKLLESAANQLLESMPDLIKDMDAMRNMTPEQKLQYIKTTLIDRIKEKSVDQVKDTVKEYIKKYAEQKVREYLFKEQIGTLVHQCIVGGQSVSSAWAGVDTVVKSQLDTGMRAFKFGMKGTEIGWDVLWVWKEKGGGPAMLKLEEKVLGEVAKYFIPGWGYYKIALSVSDALREYVLHYAFDSAYEEKLKIILPCPPQSKGFAAWILATDIPSYVNREWDEQIGYTGAYQKYFETTKPGEEQKEEFGQAMKTKLIDYLQAVKADIQKKQDIQHEVEAKVKELEKQSDEADAAVKSAISTGMSEAQKYLQMVSDFNNKFFGLAKQDVKEAIANKEKEFDQAAAGAAKEDGIKYTPIDRHTIVSALEAAGSEMTESGAQGWDVNAIRSSYETYLEIQKKEIEKVQRDVGEKTAQAQKMLEQTQKSFAPQFEALNKAHEAATTADERNRIEGQIAAVQNSYGAAIRPYSSVARDLTAQFAKDQELLVAEEGAVLMDIAERARTRNAALAVGMQVLREEIGPAAQAYQEAMIQLRADIQKLNYPDCWRGIKYVTLVGDAGQNQRRLPGDFIQSMKDLEGIKEAVEEDDRAAVNLHKREKDAFDWYSITAQNVRGAYLSLVPASLQSIGRSRDETKTSEDISGFYGVPSVSTFINRTGSQTISPQAIEIYAAGIRETMEQSRAEIMQPPVDTQAALQKINAEMSKLKPLVSADEDAQIFLRISSVLSGDSYMFDCVRFPIEREAGRAETLFTRKDGVVYPKVDPEETEGAAYLKAMKESWERNKDRVQALRDLKKKIVGVIVYTGLNESMEKTFQRDIDYYGSMPERIKIFEAEREKALKKYEDDTSRMERYVKEQREKFNAISKDYALNDQLKAFQEMDNLLSGWSALSGKATSARVQKIQEDINQLREEIKKAIEKTKADIKNYEEEQKRRLAEWQRQEAERIRLEEERKKKEAEEHGAGVLLGMELMNAKVGEHSEKDALGGNIRLMSGDLKNGAVELSAHLSSIENAESVSISLDGGGTWNEIQKNQEIRHSFVPTPKTPYKPAVKVKTTYGEKTLDMFPSGISILFEDVDFTKLVVEAMKKLSDAYEAKNAALFSELIANDFIGNKSTLEEGVRYDFDTFDSIRLQLYINRIEKRSNLYVVELKWNKSQMVRKSGKQQSLSGSTSMMFVYDDGKMKIKNLRGDLIYAALSPEIAESSGLSQAVIDNIRKARDTGTGAPPSPGQGDGGGLSSPAAGLEIGTFTLTQYKLPHPPEFDVEGYNFASKSKTRETFPYPVASDFRRREGWIEARTGGGGVIDLGSVGIDSVTEAPTSGYTGAMSGASGHVYAVQLANGTYALVETTSLSDIFTTPNTSTFKYKYQKDGTRSFK